MSDYNRDRDLKRVLRAGHCPAPQQAVDALIREEVELEAVRQRGDATYSLVRHIEVLIAILAEMRLLRGPATADI